MARQFFVARVAARGQGFEPRQADPESAVLPLDDPRSYQRARRCLRGSDGDKIQRPACPVKPILGSSPPAHQ